MGSSGGFVVRHAACGMRPAYTGAHEDAQVDEIKRHVEVVAEALRRDIRQIAEGHSGIRPELQEMRNEFRDEFKEMPVP